MKEELEPVARAVVDLKPDGVPGAARKALEAGVPGRVILTGGLAEGMRRVGEKFASGEYFIPEVLVASRAMYAGLEVVRPRIEADGAPVAGKVVLGVVKGDRHDIGKNVVKVLLEAAGFTVVDLGKNVPVARFLEALRETRPDILGLSTLMTTTLPEVASVLQAVRATEDLGGVTVLIGGAPTSPAFASEIGADGHGKDAASAVDLARKAMGGDPRWNPKP